ncbi:MAG: phage portal protein [Elusimicrobia bacterium]|nr:phage portal protein [Elusimicrobiota bacterium]
MNWLTKLMDRSFRTLGYEKAWNPAPLSGLALGADAPKMPDPSSRNYYPYLRAYADRGWVYACVSMIAQTLSGAGFILKDGRGRQVEKHPALDLLYKPNPLMSGRDLLQWIAGSLELTGNAFLLKDARAGQRPTELFPLMAHLVEILPGDDAARPVRGYKYRAGGRTAVYQPEDVVHIKYFNPFDVFYGLPPLAAARHCADTLSAAERYNRSFFDNSANVSGVLTADGRLDDATRARIMHAWQDCHRGESNAHKVALLEGGLKWQATGMSQRDMDFISGIKLNREAVLAVFHVPPALVGVYDHAPQFNTKEQQRIFWQGAIIPKLTLVLDALSNLLLPDFGDKDLWLEPDLSQVSALLEDEEGRSRAAKNYFDMGFPREAVAQALGLPFPAKGGKQ